MFLTLVVSMTFISCGDEDDFAGSSVTNSYEAVDLGLSVKWASCNVGANTPYAYGGYYAWGETSSKEEYSWNTYSLCNGSYDKLIKYNTKSNFGDVDDIVVLDLFDDVANKKMYTNNEDSIWRIPTKEEFDELLTNCKWTWYAKGNAKYNEVAGYEIESNINKNTIFLPASGDVYESLLHDKGAVGYYWTSSLTSGSPVYATCLTFSSGNVGLQKFYRNYGRSVRAVFAEK